MAEKNNEIVNQSVILASRPENLHKGSSGSKDNDLDIEKMIEKSGCSKTYYELEECLGEHNRDWTKCQQEVVRLKDCNRAMLVRKLAKN